jgi:ubiquinone/menaquinone biosynthesis C-methylase UbiE
MADRTAKTKQFFEEVKDFDTNQENIMPGKDLILKTLVDVVKFHFGKEKYKDIDGYILDIGSGTGLESMQIMSICPKLKTLAVDFSQEMNNKYKDKVKSLLKIEHDKVDFLEYDILNIPDNILKENKGKCKIVLSGYTIHHFPIKDKEKIYKTMHWFLEEGGLFINIDLYTYRSKEIRLNAHEFDINHIKKNFTDEIEKEKWIEHYKGNEGSHFIDTTDLHIKILKEIGFDNVECVFRYWQQGIIIANKQKIL